MLKIYWGLSKPITLSPGVMYSKNRNSRASIYDFCGLDDAGYLAMLEEAAKVRRRREQFEGEKSKLQEITESAWDSQGQLVKRVCGYMFACTSVHIWMGVYVCIV